MASASLRSDDIALASSAETKKAVLRAAILGRLHQESIWDWKTTNLLKDWVDYNRMNKYEVYQIRYYDTSYIYSMYNNNKKSRLESLLLQQITILNARFRLPSAHLHLSDWWDTRDTFSFCFIHLCIKAMLWQMQAEAQNDRSWQMHASSISEALNDHQCISQPFFYRHFDAGKL